MEARLQPNVSGGGSVTSIAPGVWRCEIPAGAAGRYRLAQLDDYRAVPRSRFAWRPPLRLRLRARVSAESLPGTWGFGLWNDPFSVSLGLGGMARRLPALPNAAWFFYASPPNYLSFRDDLPAQGFLAATFCGARWPSVLLALASPAMALTMLRGTADIARRGLRWLVKQDAARLSLPIDGRSMTAWHTYSLTWRTAGVTFGVDEATVFETPISPHAPLSLVLWIDNQYAALPPGGRLTYGFLANPQAAWLEIGDLCLG